MIELNLPNDYRDLLAEFINADVEFVLIGGWAVAVHGHGRATDDMDVLVRASSANSTKVFEALTRFGAPVQAHNISPELFSQPQYGYRLGRKPMLIEILTSIDGVTFDEAIADALTINVQGLQVPVIGRQALLANKRAAGRLKDLADVEALTR